MGDAGPQALSIARESTEMRRARAGRRWREALTGYLFILPAVAILGIFHFFPILYALFFSFYKFSVPNGLIPLREWYVGLDNYTRLFGDRVFGQAFFNTLWYAAGTLIFGLSLSLCVALLLERVHRGRAFFRTVYFLPYVTSLVVAGTVWQWIFRAPVGTRPRRAGERHPEKPAPGPAEMADRSRRAYFS